MHPGCMAMRYCGNAFVHGISATKKFLFVSGHTIKTPDFTTTRKNRANRYFLSLATRVSPTPDHMVSWRKILLFCNIDFECVVASINLSWFTIRLYPEFILNPIIHCLNSPIHGQTSNCLRRSPRAASLHSMNSSGVTGMNSTNWPGKA